MAQSSHDKPVWLITGCSTGFGRELATILIGRGYRVAATARDPAKLADLVAGHEASALALKLDVDKPAEIAAVVDADEAEIRPHRRARQQRRLRLPVGGRGGRGRRHPRHVRDELFRSRRDHPRRSAADAGAEVGRDRQHLVAGRLHRLSGHRLLQRHQIRGRGPVRGAGQGGRALRHQGADRRARPVPDRLGRPLAQDRRSSRSRPTQRRPSPAATQFRATAARSRATRSAPPRRSSPPSSRRSRRSGCRSAASPSRA